MASRRQRRALRRRDPPPVADLARWYAGRNRGARGSPRHGIWFRSLFPPAPAQQRRYFMLALDRCNRDTDIRVMAGSIATKQSRPRLPPPRPREGFVAMPPAMTEA